MKKKKYATGTGYDGVVRNYLETPDEALAENQIAIAKAQYEADSNPWAIGLNMFGNAAMSYASSMSGGKTDGLSNGLKAGNTLGNSNIFAMGGTAEGVEIKAEGDEVVQTPDGEVQELKGPSHENGGIDMLVPPGTDIFSKRVMGSNGKSMADRKIAREKQVKKYEKLLKKSPSDETLKKTFERISTNNQKEEQEDMAVMQQAQAGYQLGAFMMMGGKTSKGMYANGGTVPPFDFSFLEGLFGQQVPEFTGTSDDWHTGNNSVDYKSSKTPNYNGEVVEPQFKFGEPTGEDTAEGGSFLDGLFGGEGNGGGFTLGDGIGMAGNLVSTFGPMMNTKKNRAGDTPNINAFKDYGNDGLNRLEDAKGYVAGQRDNNLQDIELARTAALSRGRNSARSVNTQRALDLASTASANDAKGNIYNAFAQQMQQILGQQAGMENQQDSVVMQGEQNKDLADRQDRDNYFSQMAQDISTKGTGLQKIGRDVNQVKSRNVTGNIINEMFPNFNVNGMSGKTEFVAEATGDNSVNYLNIPDESLRAEAVQKVSSKEWKWENGELMTKDGKRVDLTTLNITE